jgi:shikimate kinase
MKNIVLIGFMGSGKTAVSGALARKTKKKAIDTDRIIEKNSRMKVKNIFARYGEPYFRELETRAALLLTKKKNMIISTGGGIVTRRENVKVLRAAGVVVYLKNSFAVSARRLKGKKDRPLFDHKNLKSAKALFKKRQKLYSAAAHLTVETGKKTVSQVADEILKRTGE